MITLTEEEAKQFTDKLKEVMDGSAKIKKELEILQKEVKDGFDMIGKELSDIINVDGEEQTDGETIDRIIDFLKKQNLYHERK